MGKRDLAWFEFLEISYVAQGPFSDCDPEQQQKKIPTIACSKYVLSWFHENSLSHNFAKRRMETT